jgi:soluble lytic murein transglycosylase-like protein
MSSHRSRLALASMCSTALAAGIAAAPAGAVVTTAAAEGAQAVRPILLEARRDHTRALRQNVRLERRHARLRGERIERDHRAEMRDWSTEHLREENAQLRRETRRLERRLARKAARARARAAATGTSAPGAAATSTAGGGTATPGHLAAIAQCESGGNPNAVGGGGAYGGKYQFSASTWQAYGGTGSPASAPEAQQDAVAARLYAAEGSSPWPTCG